MEKFKNNILDASLDNENEFVLGEFYQISKLSNEEFDMINIPKP